MNRPLIALSASSYSDISSWYSGMPDSPWWNRRASLYSNGQICICTGNLWNRGLPPSFSSLTIADMEEPQITSRTLCFFRRASMYLLSDAGASLNWATMSGNSSITMTVLSSGSMDSRKDMIPSKSTSPLRTSVGGEPMCSAMTEAA